MFLNGIDTFKIRFEVDLFLRLLLKGLVRPIYMRVYFYSDIFVIEMVYLLLHSRFQT